MYASFLIIVSSNTVASNMTNLFTNKASIDFNQLQITQFPCNKSLLQPPSSDLLIKSKYDQSDITKSTLSKSIDSKSLQKKRNIDNFSKHIVRYTDAVISSNSFKKRSIAFNCLNNNLILWSKHNALLNIPASKTGKAVRKWFLASISTSLLKLSSSLTGYTIDQHILNWLNDISLHVIADYDPRYRHNTPYFNNHDYWAAWAVASTSLLVNDTTSLSWSKKIFDRAMQNVTFDKNNGTGYFKNEIARGSLAANYSNYAFIPLMFLAELYSKNNYDISIFHPHLKALARFNAQLLTHKNNMPYPISDPQKKVPDGKLIWLLPYHAFFGGDATVTSIKQHGDISTFYSQMGGNLAPFYPRFTINDM